VPILDLSNTIAELEETLGLSPNELARAADVAPRTLARWCSEGSLPQGRTRRRLDELWELCVRLDASFSSRDAIRKWLRALSRYLGGRFSPLDAILLGRIERVNGALDALHAGVFL
jgi:DNA-binding XRE family transcriptional regulator